MFVNIETMPTRIITKDDFQDEDDKFVRGLVIHQNAVRNNLDFFAENLKKRGEAHDKSKFLSPEREGYKEMYKELDGVEYNSPEYNAIREKYKDVIKHHYANNDHHPEYWVGGIEGMDLYSLVEMYCDWKAASARNGNDIEEAVITNCKKFGIEGTPLAKILLNTALRDLRP